MAKRDHGAAQQQQGAMPDDQPKPQPRPRAREEQAVTPAEVPAPKPATTFTDWASI